MSKLKTILLIGLAVAVAACSGPTATPAPTPTAKVAAAPTATQVAPPATAPAQPTPGLAVTPARVYSPPKLDPAGMCKLERPPQPLPGFPASLPADQVKGDSKATVTLYEYSDFQ